MESAESDVTPVSLKKFRASPTRLSGGPDRDPQPAPSTAVGGLFGLFTAVVAVAGVVGLCTLAPAAAQDTVVIGGSGLRAVVVDLSVLDDNGGRAGKRQELLMPGQEAAAEIILRSPGGAAGAGRQGKLRRPMLRQTGAAGRRLARAPSRAAARPQVRSAPLAALKEAPAAPRRIEKKAAPAPAPAKTRKAPPPPAPAKIEKAPPAMTQPAPVKPVAAPSPPPAPPAAPSVVEAPPKDKVASLRPATRPGKGGPHMRIEFAGASTRLTSAAKDRLAALADELGSGKARLQLKAFAGGSAETASSARRLSLSRALAVRSFLIAEGLRSTRIDVRALGKSGGTGPAERVDIILLKR